LALIIIAQSQTASNLFAQGGAGAITGVVLDPSGSVVPGAAITIRNLDTGVSNKTATNDSGVYNVPSLIIGTYEVRVEADHFKTAVRDQVLVETANVVRVDIVLEVGTVQDKVTVTAGPPLLQPELAEAATEVTRNSLNELPFALTGSARDPFSFVRLTPGATYVIVQGQPAAAIAGGRNYYTEVYVDGVPVMYNAEQNTPSTATPAYDTVAEFRVETATPPAEYGRTSGGAVLLSTRSGTNDLHGNVVGLLHNSYFDATRFNARLPDTTRQGEFAGSLGGPVIIPHLYNGRNKTFFYLNYTGFRRVNVLEGQVATVPTSAMKNGDFSANPTVIYDPATGDAQGQRQPFPGNVIPANRISALSKTFEAAVPDPNAPGFSANYIGTAPASEHTNSFNVRIDEQISNTQKLSARIQWRDNPKTYANGPLPYVLQGSQDSPNTRGGVLNHDYILRPSVVNRFSLGVSRFEDLQISQDSTLPYKVPGAFTGGFPRISFSGQGFPDWTVNSYGFEGDDTYTLADSVSWTHGRHTFKFGARTNEWRRHDLSFNNRWGNYTFNQLTTGQPGVNGTGNSYASFLLGGIGSGSMAYNTPVEHRSMYLGLYVQDNFKVSRRLTIDYGLRWEFQHPWCEVGSRVSNMDWNTPNPGAGGALGAVIFGGTGPGRSGIDCFLQSYYGGWGPRLGMAYQLASNTVVRAGYGIMRPPLRGPDLNLTGFNANISLTSPNGGYTPAFYWESGWPTGVAKLPPFLDPTIQNGQGTNSVTKGEKAYSGMVQQWQFAVQHIVKQALIEVAYVATTGHHLQNGVISGSNGPPEQLNQLPADYLKLGSLLTQNINSPVVVAAVYALPYAGFNGTLAQSLRNFPQYGDVYIIDSSIFNSNYQALLIKAEKRLSNGLQFLVSYSLSKTLDDFYRPIDTYNRKLDKALDTFQGDVPQRLVLSFWYEFPWGKGKRILNHGFLGQVLGGIAVAGIESYSSGGVINVPGTNTLPLFNWGNRPNVVPGVAISTHPGRADFQPLNALTGARGDLYLNPVAFTQPAPFTFGTLGPVLPNIRTFGTITEDLSAVKRMAWREARYIEVRADFFNAFNRRNWTGLVTDLTSSSFGRYTGQATPRNVQFGLRVEF
jgi:hypothetical protein